MEILKEIFADIDFHLNTQMRTLDISYGRNQIHLSLTQDNAVHLSTNLILASPTEYKTVK